MKHYNITVNGRVQGVFYRASAQKIANGYQVKGFVKNLPDGNVYMEVEGSEQTLLKFINWCRRGPDSARVEKVDYTEGPFMNFSGFQIRH